MMGHRQVEQAALFYEFSLEKHIPTDHLPRSIDRFVDLQVIRRDLAPFYSSIGRPSIDPELMIRMFLIGYCLGIRSGASNENCRAYNSLFETGRSWV
jgi:transposase